LRSHGHEVMEAKDGIEALALLDEYPFDHRLGNAEFRRLRACFSSP
jgi:hypothetical protein